MDEVRSLKLGESGYIVIPQLLNTAFMGTTEEGVQVQAVCGDDGKYHVCSTLNLAPHTVVESLCPIVLAFVLHLAQLV